MVESVYLETSVISVLFDHRGDPVCQVQNGQTQAWYQNESAFHDLFASAMVLDELGTGTFDHQDEALSFAQNLRLLPIDDEVLGVARIYMDRFVMPTTNMGDAVHLAVASFHETDYVLTWNCRHLANPNKARQIAELNRRLGLLTPLMVTPPMLCREEPL